MAEAVDHRAVAEAGNRIFAERIADRVKDHDPWEAVVIDVQTGDFEVDRDVLAALDRLRGRVADPDPRRIFARRVGFESLDFLGHRPLRGTAWRKQ
ncbi:MAG TPA: hypothetical protein VF170_18570 [Planctomycetaceae bacterium]